MRCDPDLALPSRELARGDFGGEPGNTNSLSGHERDHLFWKDADGGNFVDVSALAGVDHEADGRAFGVLDLDRDGWPDLAVVNANDPTVLLYRNRLSRGPAGQRNHFVALRFQGGNRTAQAAPGLSPRDGIGARVTLTVGGMQLVRELHAGEGFAAQNSATLLVGLGTAKNVDRLTVRWPSGRVTETAEVAAGSLVIAWEVPEKDAPAFDIQPYRPVKTLIDAARGPRPGPPFPLANGAHGSSPRLRLYTTMASWCGACRKQEPRIARLAACFPAEDLELHGVPIDPADQGEKLAAFAGRYPPTLRILGDLPGDDRAAVKAWFAEALKSDALPASVVCDQDGRVLLATAGVPSVSQIRGLIPGGGG